MICNKCDNKIKNDSKFCRICGERIESRKKHPRSKNLYLFIGISLIGLMFSILIIGLIIKEIEYNIEIERRLYFKVKVENDLREAIFATGIDSNNDGYIDNKEAKKLTELNISKKKISSLDGLQFFENMMYLELSNNEIYDISALTDLKNIRYLDLSYNNIMDIDYLSNLKKIEYLDLSSNGIKNIGVIKNYIKINYLDLSMNEISSIDALNNLIKLEYLDVGWNRIKDFSPLEGKNIEYLETSTQFIE